MFAALNEPTANKIQLLVPVNDLINLYVGCVCLEVYITCYRMSILDTSYLLYERKRKFCYIKYNRFRSYVGTYKRN